MPHRRVRPTLGLRPAEWPLSEPVTHYVTDTDGSTVEVCDGHAVAARDQLVCGTVVPLRR